jgi:uncharacterized protein
MLKKFKVKNFASIGSEQEMSFDIKKNAHLDNTSVLVDKTYYNLVSCVVGANASGKTNVLKALNLFISLAKDSYSTQIPMTALYQTHALLNNKSIDFEIEFVEGKLHYVYQLSVHAGKVVKERLSDKSKKSKDIIFSLIRDDGASLFSHQGFEISQAEIDRLIKLNDTTFLSALMQLGYIHLKFFDNTHSNLGVIGKHQINYTRELDSMSLSLALQKARLEKISGLLNSWGVNVSRMTIEKREFAEKEFYKWSFVHETMSEHFELSLYQESTGTQALIYLLLKILPILETGGVVILDEIEDGVHPMLLKKIIGLFENPETNPHHAQLIFSTHQHMLLNDRTKSQIFLVERNDERLESEIYRLDDVDGVRNDENYFHKYLAGVYGAVPNISWI